MEITDSRLELDVEDVLFAGVVHGSPADYEEHLQHLDDLGSRNVSYNTLMHVAVKAGRVLWVERLLLMGADPLLMDKQGSTSLDVAKQMHEKRPECMDRRVILQLLQVAVARDGRTQREVGASKGAVLEKSEQQLIVSTQDGAVQSRLESIHSELSQELSSMKFSMSNLMSELIRVKHEVGDMAKNIVQLMESSEQVDKTPNSDPQENICLQSDDIVTEIMKRTKILNKNEKKVSDVTNMYEKLCSQGEIISTLVKFLQKEKGFEVHIDCDSVCIGNLKNTFYDVDGEKCDGRYCWTYPDVDDNRVYLGARVIGIQTEQLITAHLARSLANMAIHKLFSNQGRPYSENDLAYKKEYKEIIERITNRSRERDLDSYILWALGHKTQIGRETTLIAQVPEIIAFRGPEEGIPILKQQVPELLQYYETQVLAKIL